MRCSYLQTTVVPSATNAMRGGCTSCRLLIVGAVSASTMEFPIALPRQIGGPAVGYEPILKFENSIRYIRTAFETSLPANPVPTRLIPSRNHK